MKATERFSSRVENYIRFRPGYPKEILKLLEESCGLNSASRIADIGSGTGILSALFLEKGCEVFGLEPNRAMREAGENILRHYPRFHSHNGTAENTGLENQSVDFITAGQSFHWFDRDKARAEFQRILRPNGFVVLIWNDRRIHSTPFLQSYEKLLRDYATDYTKVDHKQIDGEVIRAFFAPDEFQRAVFGNAQSFDLEGLRGRLLSSSYVPENGEKFEEMLKGLNTLFATHQTFGRVSFEYDTVVYFGKLQSRK